MIRKPLSLAVRAVLMGAAGLAAAPLAAQDALDEIVVTGTRISQPGLESSSPIYSIDARELTLQQQPEIEKILRLLPITQPNDGQNVNNGTAGVSTVNLRGLGPQRNLVMIDGKRLVPYDVNGLVDTSMIPTALIERIDIITGGASAVYGSDAISGALNFITRRDFEGVEIDSNFSQTGDRDGDIKNVAVTLGANVADGRGNFVVSLSWQEREAVLMGARPLGRLGITTTTGAGLAEFLAGEGPPPPPAGCEGPGSVAAGGSTTTLPTRVAVAGGPGLGQFRNDGTLGSNCSVFNFNPFNFYQTPLERYGGAVVGHLELDEHAEVYTRINFGKTSVLQQIAPSGVFGTAFFTPLANPFITAQARAAIIAAAEAGRTAVDDDGNPAPTVVTGGDFPNWRDVNDNGVVDGADYLNISYRRRTVEFGTRTNDFDNENFQLLLGARGSVMGDWKYDASLSYGESNRTQVLAGYTNVANIANALDSTDGVTCANGDPSCVPINLFGGFGAITPEMAAYSSAAAQQQEKYEQTVVSLVFDGPVSAIRLPTATTPLAVSVGAEYRDESGATIPDDCLKLAPASCLGGRGGNTLPIRGGFDVRELFAEAILPIVDDGPLAQSLSLELGYRWSDYDPTGSDETWKAGLNWRPVDQLLVRVMQQRAARAPNVGELAAPRTTGLANANFDPCSIANAANITPELRDVCISTGMSAAQVGTVEDIVAGQINTFTGTDLAALPEPEQADTLTVGIVWTPEVSWLKSPIFSMDYYDIDIADFIGTFSPQEILDGCYDSGVQAQCDKIVRVGGTLTLPGAGVETFTTNLQYLRAEGIEVGFAFGVDIGRFGQLTFSGNVNKYLTQESRSDATTALLDCKGFYGTSCGSPLPEVRWVQRSTWSYDDLTVSLLWRHLGSVKAEPAESASFFPAFRKIDAYDYFDLYAGYDFGERVTLSATVSNVLDEEPPIVGNEAGFTAFNSGNTFPSTYDTLGRVYTLGLKVSF